MVTVSFIRLWYFKYVSMYVLFALALIASSFSRFVELIRAHMALSLFLLLYAGVYLLAIAFYQPISGTTLRMLLTHFAPLIFVLSCFFSRAPFSQRVWTIDSLSLTPRHFQLLVLATVGFDLAFTLRPRLLADFAGY
jgi:hypothetical protein